jgi:hypothetical protein
MPMLQNYCLEHFLLLAHSNPWHVSDVRFHCLLVTRSSDSLLVFCFVYLLGVLACGVGLCDT